ncbi:hypothetical protein QSU92_16060 [Microbacterium sp. ET2]|uniref:hypothetical protein n=1 Tax=Microbacterium albipurpureum TaxID=3050384 RepID=UPI00259C994D|nr:hypothetical protein [Microbacterium sp. ET2 (Ac-2212)]WJL95422.1 hypothetical protein QSU92_16060 [Microbacterium sp. ET2 (Ac-2212)]
MESRVGSRARGALAGVAGLALSLALVTGCTPQPEPAESQDPFATEEEAFAAAEETYRNYVDALNAVDLSDPETFEPVYEWTTGDLNASDREGLSQYHATGAEVGGASRPVLIEPIGVDPQAGRVDLAVCLDVSTVTVENANGSSLVDPDRVPVQSLEVMFVEDGDSETGLKVSAVSGREGEPSCG